MPIANLPRPRAEAPVSHRGGALSDAVIATGAYHVAGQRNPSGLPCVKRLHVDLIRVASALCRGR